MQPPAPGLLKPATLLGIGGMLLAGLGPRAQIGQAQPSPRPFAMPWEVSLRHVHHAMTALDYRVEQTRRVVDFAQGTPQWIETTERLHHQAATAAHPERYDLTLLTVGGQALSGPRQLLIQTMFRQQAASLYTYQSFRVLDVERALANYGLLLLGMGRCAERPVYHVAVYSRVGPRSLWLLGLDLETAYPLYAGEMSVDGQLVGELCVTRFAHGHDANLPGGQWWLQPAPGVQEFATADEAVSVLGLPRAIVPAPAALPAGFAAHEARVATDPLTGAKRATLVYSDGIDFLAVLQSMPRSAPIGAGHSLGVYHDSGMTQVLFQHAGVEFLVVGRGAVQPIRRAAQALYAQALR
jgi:negative regulator of sigma E activity